MACLMFMSLLLVRDDVVPDLFTLELAEAGAYGGRGRNLAAVVVGMCPILENVRYAVLYLDASCGMIVL